MNRKTLLMVASAAFFAAWLTGCQSIKEAKEKTFPGYVKPPMAVTHDKYTDIQDEEKIAFPSYITTLTLADAQRIALQNNPDFIKTRFSIDSARSRFYQSFSGYVPTLNVGMSISQQFGKTWSTNVGSQSESYSPSISGQWLIFDSLNRELGIIARKWELKQTKTAQDDAKRLLLRAVAYAFADIQLSVTQKIINQARIDYAQKMLDETELKYNAGSSLLTDVLNFRITLRNAELDMVKAENDIRAKKYVLAGYLGLTDGTIPDSISIPLIDEERDVDMSRIPSIDVILDTALSNRPDLRSVREKMEQTKYTFWQSMTSFGPKVTMDYSLGYSKNRNVPGNAATDITRSGSFRYGMSASWNLFNGFSDYFNAKAAYANLASVDYELANTWLTLITDVRTAYDNYKCYLEQTTISKEVMKMTSETRDLVENQYKAGAVLVTRLNEVERDLVSAQENYALSLVNTQRAKAQLDAAYYATKLDDVEDPNSGGDDLSVKGYFYSLSHPSVR